MFHGSIVALVTPMTVDAAVDYAALENLVAWHLEAGTDAIVVLGSTGEGAAFSEVERKHIIRQTVEQVGGKIPVICGTGTNNTDSTIAHTRDAMQLGVDAVLLVTPYYVRPTQLGMVEHFKHVAASCAVPQIIYNVPVRTGCDMLPATIAKLAGIANIVGVKEASGDRARIAQIIELSDGRLDVFCGNDTDSLANFNAGARGVISVTANLRPRLMHKYCQAFLSGNIEQAQELHTAMDPLHRSMGLEPNPIPCKWALHKEGRIAAGIRLPLTWLAAEFQQGLEKILLETKNAEEIA